MKDKHTPGLWTAENHEGNHWRIVAASPHVAGLNQDVANINGPWDADNYAANAKLIAAAPDLLEACRHALDTFGGVRPDSWAKASREEFDILMAAIAKATGTPE